MLEVSLSFSPYVIDGEAYGRYEEILHPVEAIANWLGVDGVMGCASTGLTDHLIHRTFTQSFLQEVSQTQTAK